LQCAPGFAYCGFPCVGGDDELCKDRVEVCAHDGRRAVDEGRVDSDAVAGWEVEGLDLADA